MDGKTGESLDSDGGNDGRGNNLPESTGHTVNHEMETPLNFKMRTLERPETVTAATTAAAMTCLKTRSSDSWSRCEPGTATLPEETGLMVREVKRFL